MTELSRSATYWLRMEELVESGSRDNRRVRWKERGWKEVDGDLYRRYLSDPRAEGADWRVVDKEVVTDGRLTLLTRVRDGEGWRDGPTAVIPVDDVLVAPIVDAWGDGSADIVEWVTGGPTGADGVDIELHIRGRLVLARKEAGVWPERRRWTAELPKPLELPMTVVAP